MMKYILAAGTLAMALAISQFAPTATSGDGAMSTAPRSRHTPVTFEVASADLATVGAAPRDDSSDSGDDGGDDSGDDGGSE
jgi:hypothetical protein